MPQAIRDYITATRNCEDIAMNMLVSSTTGLPPLYVSDKFKVDYGSRRGIYTRNGHMATRHACVRDISALFERSDMVLMNSSLAYVLGRTSVFRRDKFRSREYDENILLQALRQSSYSDAHRLHALESIRSHLRGSSQQSMG